MISSETIDHDAAIEIFIPIEAQRRKIEIKIGNRIPRFLLQLVKSHGIDHLTGNRITRYIQAILEGKSCFLEQVAREHQIIAFSDVIASGAIRNRIGAAGRVLVLGEHDAHPLNIRPDTRSNLVQLTDLRSLREHSLLGLIAPRVNFVEAICRAATCQCNSSSRHTNSRPKNPFHVRSPY